MDICAHNPLVPGSSPGGPTRKQNPHRPRWGFIYRLVVTYKDSLTISAL
jgi:hypothetical protein